MTNDAVSDARLMSKLDYWSEWPPQTPPVCSLNYSIVELSKLAKIEILALRARLREARELLVWSYEITQGSEVLVGRLRDADRDSVQRALGSRIFGEAANVIERFTTELAERTREVERLNKAYDALTGERFGERVHAALRSRAITAEAALAAEKLKRQQAEHERDSMLEHVAGLERDARRYRWLRDAEGEVYESYHWSIERYDHARHGWDVLDGEELDAAIDAAIRDMRREEGT